MGPVNLHAPTPSFVSEYIVKFESDEDVVTSDLAVRNLFSQFPNNLDFDDILRKVIVLNQLYNTRLWTTATLTVARNIHKLNVDELLRRHETGVVASIAAARLKGKDWNFYSFASKYCSFHVPEAYPIYDQYVDRLLNTYRREFGFADFKAIQLKDYSVFKNVILQYRTFFELQSFPLKQLDKFLWMYGSELFGKSTKN